MYQVEIGDFVKFKGKVASQYDTKSVFPTLDQASDFHAKGSVGYSLSRDKSHFQGMELRLLEWDIQPMHIESAFVRLYDQTFPTGVAKLDSAMIMRGLKHEWHRIPVIPAQR